MTETHLHCSTKLTIITIVTNTYSYVNECLPCYIPVYLLVTNPKLLLSPVGVSSDELISINKYESCWFALHGLNFTARLKT